MNQSEEKDKLTAFISKMENEGLPPLVIDTFTYYFHKVIKGETGLLYDRDIKPVVPDEIEDFFNLSDCIKSGVKAYDQTVSNRVYSHNVIRFGSRTVDAAPLTNGKQVQTLVFSKNIAVNIFDDPGF